MNGYRSTVVEREVLKRRASGSIIFDHPPNFGPPLTWLARGIAYQESISTGLEPTPAVPIFRKTAEMIVRRERGERPAGSLAIT